MEAVEELIPEVDELIAEVELVEVDMKGLVVKEVVSGHGDVEGLVVVVGCVLLWLEADNHIHNQTIGSGSGVSLGVARMAAKQKPKNLIAPVHQSFDANISMEARHQIIDSNITFIPAVHEKKVKSPMEPDQKMVTADALIPPYDAPKIGALNDDDPAEEDEMQEEFAGNELMVIEDDDLLGAGLMQMDDHSNNQLARLNDSDETIQPDMILIIEEKPEGDEADSADTNKALVESVRRASPRIRAISSSKQANGAGRGRLAQQSIYRFRRFRCLSIYGDLKTIKLSPYFDIRYRFELGFQFNRFEVNKQHIADVMPVLLKSGQSASREEAVEEMKDCRSTVHPCHRSTVMPEYGQAYFMTD
ncbi:hypothetical protein IGI04_040034 [Brassica rapa subsp. trilocularis]|uniref:Uncharacterized protein n=1 Tax=Brassica rapa subsp. trilocularis TaxID=1813537 RepID=A0ABQ7KMI0_BRACM|nr:hypothetical protein IGI04_040034 [Brassica rapa subsp. trilocularis]